MGLLHVLYYQSHCSLTHRQSIMATDLPFDVWILQTCDSNTTLVSAKLEALEIPTQWRRKVKCVSSAVAYHIYSQQLLMQTIPVSKVKGDIDIP